MGESKNKLKTGVVGVREVLDKVTEVIDQMTDTGPMNVVTAGGRFQVNWDTKENATTMGQLTFFAEFLELAGLFERWVQQCPLRYTSPNAPSVRDVLGTWMFAILDGQRRYAHVASLRGDAVAPKILGMNHLVGDESLRRGLALIAPAPKKKPTEVEHKKQQDQILSAEQWMSDALKESVQHALVTAWILDIDTTLNT